MTTKRHLPWLLSGLVMMSTLANAASTDAPEAIDLSGLEVGDVVLRGELIDGVCTYPRVLARAAPAEGLVLLQGTDDCAIVRGDFSSFDGEARCSNLVWDVTPIQPPSEADLVAACAGTQGDPLSAKPHACAAEVDPTGAPQACALDDPTPLIASVDAGNDTAIPMSHCNTRNLNSYLSSGPTTVGASMNFREHCNAGARVNSWSTYCSWNSGDGWRNRWYGYYGNSGPGSSVHRGIDCGFRHQHWWGSHGYHWLNTYVYGSNWGSEYCAYSWQWNDHTNYVVYGCW